MWILTFSTGQRVAIGAALRTSAVIWARKILGATGNVTEAYATDACPVGVPYHESHWDPDTSEALAAPSGKEGQTPAILKGSSAPVGPNHGRRILP